MFPYFLLWLFVVACCYFASDVKVRQVQCLAVILLVMLVMVGLRDVSCGQDTLMYKHMHKYHTSEKSSLEYLFTASYLFIKDFQVWLFVIAAATYIPLYFILKKEVLYCTMAMLVFLTSSSLFFVESFNIIRQALAGSFTLFAFVLWERKRYVNMSVCFIIAILIHSSSVVAVPFILFKYLKPSFKAVAICIAVSCVLGFTSILSAAIQDAVMQVNLFADDNTQELLNKYSLYGTSGSNINFFGLMSAILPLSITAIITYPFTKEAKEKYGFYYNIFFITTCIGNIVIPSMEWGFRLTFALQYVQMLVIPLAYQYGNKRQKNWITIVLVVMSLYFFYYLNRMPTNSRTVRGVVPYKVFF